MERSAVHHVASQRQATTLTDNIKSAAKHVCCGKKLVLLKKALPRIKPKNCGLDLDHSFLNRLRSDIKSVQLLELCLENLLVKV